jgi:hypothetical protein
MTAWLKTEGRAKGRGKWGNPGQEKRITRHRCNVCVFWLSGLVCNGSERNTRRCRLLSARKALTLFVLAGWRLLLAWWEWDNDDDDTSHHAGPLHLSHCSLLTLATERGQLLGATTMKFFFFFFLSWTTKRTHSRRPLARRRPFGLVYPLLRSLTQFKVRMGKNYAWGRCLMVTTTHQLLEISDGGFVHACWQQLN